MANEETLPKIVRGNKFRLLITLEAVDSEGRPVPLPIEADKWHVRVRTMTARVELPISGMEGEKTLKCDVAANTLPIGTFALEAYTDDYRYSKQRAFAVVEYSAEAGLPTEAGEEIEVQTLSIVGTIEKGGSGGGGTSDYNELANKPKVNGVTLQGDVPTSSLHIPYADIEGVPTIPTKTSELVNDVPFAYDADLNVHVDDFGNPHEVTKAQVGLGNVDNTSDANKPISTATAAALARKADKDNVVDLDTAQFIEGEKTFRRQACFNNGLEALGALFIQEGEGGEECVEISTMQPYIPFRLDGMEKYVPIRIGTPTDENDATTKGYVDGLFQQGTQALVDETSARQAADTDLLAKVNAKADNLSLQAETSARQAADALLQPKTDAALETISTTIVGAINEIRANLVQEGQTRTAADNALQEELDTKVTSIPAQESNPFVYGRKSIEDGGTEGKFTMSPDVLTGCVVKRNGDTSILVRTSPTRENEAIGKAYADLAAQQVKQTQSTTDSYFPIIHKVNGDSAERLAQVYFNGKVAMNPSTGDVKATTFTEGGTALASKYATMAYVDERIGEIEIALSKI